MNTQKQLSKLRSLLPSSQISSDLTTPRECRVWVRAVQRRRFSVGASPTRQLSLQPEAISRQDRRLYSARNNIDPPDSWEILRNEPIKAIRDLGNRYIENYQQLDAEKVFKRYQRARQRWRLFSKAGKHALTIG